jgi:hypothetical protein
MIGIGNPGLAMQLELYLCSTANLLCCGANGVLNA